MELIGEPFTRSDGKEVAIYDDGSSLVTLRLDDLSYFYSKDRVLAAGQGDIEMGYVRLGQAANRATAEDTDNYALRPTLVIPEEQI